MESQRQTRSLSGITREEIYGLIWERPVVAVAANLGVSAPAIVHHCKKHEVPRPPRGYWARKEAGKNPRKKPLPPTREEVFLEAAEKPAKKALRLPVPGTVLHPLAIELLTAIRAGNVASDGRVNIRLASIPKADVTKALAERTAVAFHVLIERAGSLGIVLGKSRSDYSGGFFRKGHDRLYLKIEEGMTQQAEVHPGGSRTAGWQYRPERKTPSGLLAFSLSKESWEYGQAKRWSENEHGSLEKALAQVASEICRHFAETHRQRVREAIEREKQRVEWQRLNEEHRRQMVIRQQQEAEEKHVRSLVAIRREREENLLKAAESWHRHRRTEEFIGACESRWRDAQADRLTVEQERWLEWAREINHGLSPFGADYPNPTGDGSFDVEAVPFGGPYPEVRKFP